MAAPDYSQIFGNQNWVDIYSGNNRQDMLTTPTAPAAPMPTDQSGWNLSPSDPYYALYNAPAGRTPGVDWWYGDDRNNPALHPELMTGPTNYNPIGFNNPLLGDPYYTEPGQPLDPRNPYPSQGTSTGPTGGGGGPIPPVPSYAQPSPVTPGSTPGQTAMTTSDPNQTVGTTPGGPATATAATPTSGMPGAAPGSSLQAQLEQRYKDQIAAQDKTIADYRSRFDPALAAILARSNTAEGFDPATLSALRSEATAGIPKQYENAARAARQQLLRSGAIGAGELPGTGADILRAFAPLDQARADAVSAANRDTILKNAAEEKRTLDLNRDRGQTALNQLTTGTGMIGDLQNPNAAGALANQGNLANLDADTRLKIANLDAETQKWMGTLNADTQKWAANLSADTQKALANLSATTQTNLANLDANTRLEIARLDNAPGSFKQILLSSLLSGVMAPGANGQPSIISKGIGGIIDLVTGKSKTAAETAASAGTVGGSVGGGLGTTISGFLTNPVTIGVGVALAAGALWLKSQAKWEANTMVQKFENPFHNDYLTPFVDEFSKAFASGQLTKAQASDMRSAFAQNWNDYVTKAREFGKKGSDEKTVSDQSILNLWNVAIQPILGSVDKAIGSLA